MSFKMCTTLYAFTNEWQTRRYTFEQLVEQSVRRGLGPGIEVIGPQSFRGYPHLTKDDVARFRATVDRFGLEPASLGGSIDVARRRDRLMTRDEVLEELRAQLEAARQLRMPVLRAYTPKEQVDRSFLEEAARLGEKAGVTIGVEIHSPNHVDHPATIELREAFDRIDSPALGFIPDWSSTLTDLPKGQLEALRHNGLTAEHVAFLRDIWLRGGRSMGEMFTEFAERAYRDGAKPSAVEAVRIVFSQFAHNDASRWIELMPRTVYVHAKFYELEADGTDISVPHRQLVNVLLDAGYAGYVASEWEGMAWLDIEEADAFEMVQRHQTLYRRLIAERRTANASVR